MKRREIQKATLNVLDGNEQILSIQEIILKDKIIYVISGELRNNVAHDFEDEIIAGLTACDNIEIDFSQVTYIASFAMKALLDVQQIFDKQENGRLIIKNVSPKIMEEFETMGFDSLFEFINE